MGTMVGDDGGDNQIGVAPGAQWFAAKGCESRSCSDTALLASMQFMLAPTDLNGANPNPDLRPHIVNNSWGGGPVDSRYQDAVQAWVAAGVFPVFSNGNSGPGCGTAGQPALFPESYAVGNYTIGHTIAFDSSRGPAPEPYAGIKPNISAPGTNVRSAWNDGGYVAISGTSMAAPHVSGAIALLWSASDLLGDIEATKDLLNDTAIPVVDLTCGGEPEFNNVWGHGRLNAYAAVQAVLMTGTLTGRSPKPTARA